MLHLDVFTDDPDLAALCRRYWQRDGDAWVEPVRQIASEFSVPSHKVVERVNSGSVAVDTDVTCDDCGAAMPVSSRSDYPAKVPRDGLCPDCRSDRQAEAEELARQREAEQRAIIADRFAMDDRDPVDLEDLSFGQAAALLAVLRAGASEDNSTVLPMREWEQQLAPSHAFGVELIEELWHAGALQIGPDSAIDAFSWEDDDPARFYFERVEWRLPGDGLHHERVRDLTDELQQRFRDTDWPAAWTATWRSAWDRLMREEALAYLHVSLDEHQLPFKAGDKTHDVLDYVLTSFSLGQAYYFIWGATRDAAAYWMREDIPKQRAANSVVGRLRSRAERALADGWDVSHYRRDRRCPVTVFGEVVCSLALKRPDPFPVAPDEIRPPLSATG